MLPRWVAVVCASGCNSNLSGPATGAAPTAAEAQPNLAQPRPTSGDLQTFLHSVIANPALASSADLVALLQASPATWHATIIAPFTGCRAASNNALATATATLWTALRTTPTPKIAVRKHYAGDDGLPAGAAHLRWALPVLFESYVVALGDRTVDMVFWPEQWSPGVDAHSGDETNAARWRWRAMGNIDAALAQAILQGTSDNAALTRCAVLVVASHHNERCLQLAAAVVVAALHHDHNATSHACALADVHCTEGR